MKAVKGALKWYDRGSSIYCKIEIRRAWIGRAEKFPLVSRKVQLFLQHIAKDMERVRDWRILFSE